MLLSRGLTFAMLLLIACPALSENRKQQEIGALINRAKQLSDIRADGSPGFRLTIAFKILNKDSAPTEGTYTELWVSSDKWRREAIAGDVKRVVVADGGKTWTTSPTDATTRVPRAIGLRMDVAEYNPEFWKDGKVKDRDSGSFHAGCLESANGFVHNLFCFDKSSGLAALDSSVSANDSLFNSTCTYADYRKFGEKVFPRTMECTDGKGLAKVFESSVRDLVLLDSPPDPALFVPVAGSKESVNCHGIPEPPRAVDTPPPFPVERGNATVVLSMLVGVDGKPNDLKVVRSVDAETDKAATDAVRRWRFKPANCAGQPIEATINVEVNFRMP